MKKILIIEDNEKHLEDAINYFSKNSDISVDYAKTLKEALKMIEINRYDGIISDIFFPSGFDVEKNNELISNCFELLKKFGIEEEEFNAKKEKEERIIKRCKEKKYNLADPEYKKWYERELELVCGHDYLAHKALLEWKNEKALAPLGILIPDYCNETSVVFCSDSYHHGYAAEPAWLYLRRKNFEFIDAEGFCEMNGNSSNKNWGKAFEELSEKFS